MTVNETILNIIKANMFNPQPLSENSDLYIDLGFDSLSVTGLLIEIEDTFSISFDFTEMQKCFVVGELIRTVQEKLLEGGRGND